MMTETLVLIFMTLLSFYCDLDRRADESAASHKSAEIIHETRHRSGALAGGPQNKRSEL